VTVGAYFDTSPLLVRSLIARWNGATWKPVANPQSGFPLLFGVACVTSSSCYAVGFHGLVGILVLIALVLLIIYLIRRV